MSNPIKILIGLAISIIVMLVFIVIPKTGIQQAGRLPNQNFDKKSIDSHRNEQKIDPSAQNQLIKPGRLQEKVQYSDVTVELNEETVTDFPDFTQHEYTIHTNDTVSLTFRNQTSSNYNYRHSWILLDSDSTVEKEGAAAEKAGPNYEYIPQTSNVLAHTSMLSPGESETIYFRAPEKPGDYPFICGYPGHHLNMQGVLHVESNQ